MKIIPAIDLLDGQAVRLQKGDYNKKTVYSDRPVEEALKFREAGFSHIHVVDLNAAKSGSFDNLPIIREIIDETGLSPQTGGVVRRLHEIELHLESGLLGVICSSMAVKSPQEWHRAGREHADKLTLGLDLKNGKMACSGWRVTSDKRIEDFLNPIIQLG